MRLFEEITKLIRNVEPSMGETPIYLLDADEWEGVDMPLDLLAFTAYTLDLQQAKRLNDSGVWRGPGFAAVFYTDRLPKIAKFVAGTALHELAHWLTFPPRPALETNDLAKTSAFASELFELATKFDVEDEKPRPPWHRHESDFVRAATHLAYRAGRLDPEIRPWNLEFSQRYYSVCELAWMRVLADECRAMADVPIRDILATDPPRDFAELARLLTGWWDQPNRAKESVC